MDVDHGLEFAERIRTERERLMQQVDALHQNVRRSQAFWVGPDADAFRSTWEAQYSSMAQGIFSGLARSAETLERNIDEQEDASAARDDGTADGGTAGGGDGAQDVVSDDPRDRGTVDPDVARAWRTMNDEERREVAQEIVDQEFERYGMDPVEITFEGMDGNGYWSEGFWFFGPTLAINEDRLSDPDILHTLTHEVRHGAQHEFIDQTSSSSGRPGMLESLRRSEAYEQIEEEHGFTREEIRAWRDNFRDYHSPPDALGEDPSAEERAEYQEDRDRYLDQSVEVDARKGGREFVDGLTFEDLQDLQRDAEVPISEDPE